MMPPIRNVVVLGAGTMGSGIAAHLANLGFRVSLLDLTKESTVVAFDRAKSNRPPHFYVPERSGDVRLGSIEEDLRWIEEADWVVEAIIEKPEAKRSLYEMVAPRLAERAWISTNTSGLEIGRLADGLPDSFRRKFIGTHFFNPPRYLKLLELIPTPETDPEVVDAMTRFLEESVARRVVPAKDTPGFIANRYGMWCMYLATHVTDKLRLRIEDADAITGPFLGRPKSGSFRLNDLVGLDVMEDIARNLVERCVEDPHTGVLARPTSMNELIARGWLGEKSGQGYYRKEGKELLAFDLQTLAYRQRRDSELPVLAELGRLPLGERLSRAIEGRDEVGEFLRMYLLPALRYANSIKEEISHNVRDFDRVMKWGFGWEMGPFELIDAIGADRVGVESGKFYESGAVRAFDGVYFMPAPEPDYARIQDFPVISESASLAIRQLPDGVLGLSTKTKLGVVGPDLLNDLNAALDDAGTWPLVLTSESPSFSVGFDLKFLLGLVDAGDEAGIDAALRLLQSVSQKLETKSAVAAVQGYCLGGGFELALGCSQIVAAAESQIGLPESKVGLIPGGRGTVLMRLYNQQSAKTLAETALRLTHGENAPNADMARVYGYLRTFDTTCYHPDRLISMAVERARNSKPLQRPEWATVEGPLVGMIDRGQQEAMARGTLTGYDESIGDKIKSVFAKVNGYEAALERERAEFLDLTRKALSQARLRHMVENKKPLRN